MAYQAIGVKPADVWKSTSPVVRMLLIMCSAAETALSMLMPRARDTSERPSMMSLQAWSNANAAVIPLPITSMTFPRHERRNWPIRKVWKYFCRV